MENAISCLCFVRFEAPRQVRLGKPDVKLGPVDELPNFSLAELSDKTHRSPKIKRAGFEPLTVGNEAAGAQNGP